MKITKVSRNQNTKNKQLNNKNTKNTKHKKTKFIKLTLKNIIKNFKKKNSIKKPLVIEYYYSDGGNPNKMSKDYLETYKYLFIPNGNLIKRIYKNEKYEETIIENYLNNADNKKLPYDIEDDKKIYYFLDGKHKLYPNLDYFKSRMQICHKPRHVLSDTCIGGQNWIKTQA